MALSAGDVQTQLDAVDAAIANALSAQSYTVGGRSKTNASIEALFRRRDFLQMQLDRINGAAPMFARGVVKTLH